MKKAVIIHGKLETDLQKRAIEELSAILLDCTQEYPVCISYGEKYDLKL